MRFNKRAALIDAKRAQSLGALFWLCCGLSGCSAPTAAPAPSPAPSAAQAQGCTPERGLFLVRESLATGDACAAWLRPLAERAVRVEQQGSAALWSLRAPAGPALLLSAAHVLSPCPPALGCAAALRDPAAQPHSAFVRLTEPSGAYASQRSAAHLLAHPRIAPQSRGYERVWPAQDFAVCVLDGQLSEPWEPKPPPLNDSAPALSEAAEQSMHSANNWADAQAGERVLAIGYPLQLNGSPSARASVLEVLEVEAARAVWQQMATQGIDEGEIAFAPEVEVWLRGAAPAAIEELRGMSGSGVYDAQGRLVAILVRAAVMEGALYLRAVHARYIIEQVRALYRDLSEPERTAISKYLDPELTSESP